MPRLRLLPALLALALLAGVPVQASAAPAAAASRGAHLAAWTAAMPEATVPEAPPLVPAPPAPRSAPDAPPDGEGAGRAGPPARHAFGVRVARAMVFTPPLGTSRRLSLLRAYRR